MTPCRRATLTAGQSYHTQMCKLAISYRWTTLLMIPI